MVGSEENCMKRVGIGYIRMVERITKVAELSSAHRVKEGKVIMRIC